jgi:DNA helicase-4
MSDLFDAKVMAVGDDWQTIFGYSGSRVDLFKNFESEMEEAKSVPIEHTYRNSQELIDIAGTFILKNEDQIEKSNIIQFDF